MSAKKPEITVFIIRRASECRECGETLEGGSWITPTGEGENRDAVCLECADLDHLVYLPRGNAALTRRAAKYSALRGVVVEWSRNRQRYERQGTLVEAAALARAEEECLADSELRAARAARRRESDAAMDERHVGCFRDAILDIYPSAPEAEALDIARRACERNSGRVGRAAAARDLDPAMVRLAVRAHLRHRHTAYDKLLMGGMDRLDARHEIAAELDDVEARWMLGG